MIQPWRQLDRWLNSLTMYRLVLYGLGMLAAVALGLSAGGVLAVPLAGLVESLAVLLVVCPVVNWLLATAFEAATGTESGLITALILFFVLAPAASPDRLLWVALAGVLAMASKYGLAFGRKHIFNPAAFGAAALGVTGLYGATWWVGTPVLLPFTLVLGLLVVRKIRRFQLVGAFMLAAAMMLVITHGRPVADILWTLLASWPLVFMGTIMLTEPATTPPRQRDMLVYGGLVGLLFTSQSHLGLVYSTPEVVLLVGNLFSYVMSPKYRWRLQLTEQVKLTDDIIEFRFRPERPLAFTPGQYMDVIVPHARVDGRGNRRTFSLASAPSESQVRFTTRLAEPSSSFKKALRSLKPGSAVMAGQLAGNFALPANPQQPVVLIAGGIGITPFRSMIQTLLESKQRRAITLLYCANAPADFVYRNLFEAARSVGLRAEYYLTARDIPADWTGKTGFLTADGLRREVPAYAEAVFLLSGPNVMVESYRRLLRQLGVKPSQIKTDYFSGY